MNKVIAATVSIIIAIFPTMASAEKLWGHDVWAAMCVPPKGENYYIGVTSAGFAKVNMDGKVIALYPNIESVSVNQGVALEIVASNSTERAVAEFDIRYGAKWVSSPKDDPSSGNWANLGAGIDCGAVHYSDSK